MKTKISEYSTTNSSNTDIEGINIDEGCPPSSINNAIRELMVHLKEFQTGASGDAFTFAGGTLMSGTNTISGAAVISGNINSSGTTNTFSGGNILSGTNTISGSAIISGNINSSGTTNTFSGGNIFSGTNTFSGTNVFSSDVTLNAQKDLRFADSDSSNWVAFQAPATVASNVTWTLPAADGTANQALVTNGSGTLSFATSSSLTGVTDSASPFETALGTGAGGSNTGTNNTFIGYNAGNASTSGAYNTALGTNALKSNTTAGDSTAIGAGALETSTGQSNTAVGAYSLNLNTTGTYNTAVGRLALYANTTGADNTAVGFQALDACTTGLKNVAIGYNALGSLSTGREYVAIGYDALANAELTNDGSHTAVGKNAGKNATSGYGSIFIGRDAGLTVTTGSLSTYVGYASDASSASVSGEIVLCTAHGATGKGANTAFINANGGSTFNGANSSSWNTTSDQRLKKNIVDNNEGLDIISQLRVRNFEYRTEEEVTDLPTHAVINKEGVQLGVIAQELQQVCPSCVTEQSTGVLSVDTDEIFWHMVNAIKDLKAINDAQATRIETLEAQNAAFESRLAALEAN